MQQDVQPGSLESNPNSWRNDTRIDVRNDTRNDTRINTRINTRSDFQQAVRDAFASLATTDSREVIVCDEDFADWPLGEIGVIEALTAWAKPQRKLQVFALNFDDVLRRHPRWVAWRRQFAHLVECRVVEPPEQSRIPALFTARGGVTVRLFDADRFRGTQSGAATDAALAREAIDVISQRSAEGFAATTLGL